MRQHTAMMSESTNSNGPERANRQQAPSRSIFDVPAPIKQLFDRFPLCTYSVNDLPQRAPHHRNAHILYIFTTDEGALRGLPSYNPACLKWQVSPSHIQSPLFSPISQHPRPTLNSPKSPFESHQPPIMLRQAARFLSFFLLRQSRTSRHSQSHRGSCNDGP